MQQAPISAASQPAMRSCCLHPAPCPLGLLRTPARCMCLLLRVLCSGPALVLLRVSVCKSARLDAVEPDAAHVEHKVECADHEGDDEGEAEGNDLKVVRSGR